ncbi:hypothetical protein L9F63_022601, partial [Diploptera punctata]
LTYRVLQRQLAQVNHGKYNVRDKEKTLRKIKCKIAKISMESIITEVAKLIGDIGDDKQDDGTYYISDPNSITGGVSGHKRSPSNNPTTNSHMLTI